MSRLAETFAGLRATKRPGLVTYVTAGDPTLPRTRGVLDALDRAGADVLEVGVPFSDPLADGPVIQRATERALAAGTTLSGVLDLIGEAREGLESAGGDFQLRQPDSAPGCRAFRRSGARGWRRWCARPGSADRGSRRFPEPAEDARD